LPVYHSLPVVRGPPCSVMRTANSIAAPSSKLQPCASNYRVLAYYLRVSFPPARRKPREPSPGDFAEAITPWLCVLCLVQGAANKNKIGDPRGGWVGQRPKKD
jgi:hypothetical protein